MQLLATLVHIVVMTLVLPLSVAGSVAGVLIGTLSLNPRLILLFGMEGFSSTWNLLDYFESPTRTMIQESWLTGLLPVGDRYL